MKVRKCRLTLPTLEYFAQVFWHLLAIIQVTTFFAKAKSKNHPLGGNVNDFFSMFAPKIDPL